MAPAGGVEAFFLSNGVLSPAYLYAGKHLHYRTFFSMYSAPYSRRFDGQATATPGNEQFQIDIVV